MTTSTRARSITHLSFDPAGEQLLYVEDRATIKVQPASGEALPLTEGDQPSWLGKDRIAFVRDHEVYTISASGGQPERLFDRSAGFLDTSKGSPVGRPDGQKLLVVIRDVKRQQSNWVPDKAYPVRHFFGIGDLATKTLTPINSWWYGGKAIWLPGGERFAHHEFDATGGARLHITNLEGEDERVFRGYLPRCSPDGKRLATVSHDFDKVQVTPLEGDGEVIDLLIPADLAGGRFNNPALWVSDDAILLEAHGTILEWRLDAPKAPIRRAQVAIARRGLPTLAASPKGDRIAYEAAVDGGTELRIIDSGDWRKETLPEPKPATEASGEASDSTPDADTTEG